MEFDSAAEWAATSLRQARRVRAKDGARMNCVPGNTSGSGDGFEPYSAFLLLCCPPIPGASFSGNDLGNQMPSMLHQADHRSEDKSDSRCRKHHWQ